MKKKILISFILILCGFFCVSNATKVSEVYLEATKEQIENGEEVEIIVNLKDEKVAACNFSIYFDELKFDYVSDLKNTNVVDNHVNYVWYDENGGSGAKSGKIAKFKFKAKDNGTATFNIDGEFYSETGSLIKTSFRETRSSNWKRRKCFARAEKRRTRNK